MRFATSGRIRPPSPPPPTSPPTPPSPPPKTVTVDRRWLLVAASVLVGLVLVIVAWPRPPVVEGPTFEQQVEAYLRKRPPDPSPANVAFAVIRPSLVVIQGKEADAAEDDPHALGAGVVVAEDGTILTCLHVVAGSDTILVTFADGFQTEATLITAQAENDLAVLAPHVVPENLVPAILAGTGDVRIGDPVVAVGNPFGLVGSVSEGVVSGLDRRTETEGFSLDHLIQFDAAVNPGNSGGPLLNRRGEVIGLVTALLNPTKQNFFVGIGYAITIETAGRAFDIPPW